MKFIDRKTHAVLDYIVGIVLIAAPWLLGFSDNEAAKWSAVAVGVIIILMSLITNYEGGAIKIIPINVHLVMDVITGIFLVASPWLLGFGGQVYLPHIIVGLLEIVVVICTRATSTPSQEINTTRPGFWYR